MILADGSGVDRLELTPGVRFEVGGTGVECVRVDGEGKSQKAKGKSEDDMLTEVSTPGKTVEMPRLVACPTCYRDMAQVAVGARFCPTCGAQLPPRDAEGYLIPPEESSPLYPVYRALRDELEAKLTDESPQAASSLIILAYANALLNLGWRYEHGRGILRNVEEAARCYAKAGRLSEAWDKGKG
jgi:TPR repeat protein